MVEGSVKGMTGEHGLQMPPYCIHSLGRVSLAAFPMDRVEVFEAGELGEEG